MLKPKSILNLSAILTALWTSLCPTFAQELTNLQVSPNADSSETIELDLKKLDELDQVAFATTTIWTDGAIRFSGVALKDLLNYVGANGNTIEMVALNDYSVSMPVSVLENEAPIIATRMNGKKMSIRDKGPFWVVFPYDDSPKYQTEHVYSLSIWQLSQIRLLK